MGVLTQLLDTDGFMPRWYCGDWSSALGWLHITSDVAIWGAYTAIPMVLIYFVLNRRDVPFYRIFWLFGAFILACGTGHLIEAVIFWHPVYRLSGAVKLITAVVSWGTVVALIPVIPKALGLPGIARLNDALRKEVEDRKRTEQTLRAQRTWFEVTLSSIGDAVVATDANARVTFMNAVAERLTGWTQAEAHGRPLVDSFHIINERTRNPVEDPCAKVLQTGHVVGLANHTVLVAKNGDERPIDDSAAPITADDGTILGVVLIFRDATEQRRAADATGRLAAIVADSEDAIIGKNLEGTITSWNASAERLYGIPAQEAIGQPMSIIIPRDRLDEEAALVSRLTAGERIANFDTVRRCKDGSLVDVSLTVSPIKNREGEVIGASKIARDITARKHGEDRLRFLADASSALVALIDYQSTMQRIARMAVPFFADWCYVDMVNDQGRIERVAFAHRNPTKEALLKELIENYPVDPSAPSFSIKVFSTGVPELVPEVHDSLLRSLARDERQLRLAQSLNPRSFMVVPLLVRDRPIGTLIFVMAESGRAYAESDLGLAQDLARRAATAIDNARLVEALRRADKEKDDFLAMLAHELRNPLAAIQYANELSRMGVGNGSAATDVIDRQVKSLSRLIDDLLDVSRLTRNKVHLNREPIDAATIVRRAVATTRPVIDERKHELEVVIAPGPMPLFADPTRAEQVVVNLLANAAKYTPEGGKITVQAVPEANEIVIRVRDTGVGIPPEMVPRVFELFTQLDRSLDRSEGGLGIGLTVVRHLVEMHGGTVAATSKGLGQGSEFTVRLPRAEMAPYQRTGSRHGRGPRPGLRVLVVDDNVDTARGLAVLLKNHGCMVETAHDGRTALDKAHASRPDAMLLDIGLPEIDGYRVAQSLRKEPGFSQTTLIAISGYGQEADRRRSKEAGFDDHLVKPVDLDALLAALSKVHQGDGAGHGEGTDR
ncbi:MAG: PAS domain S-box protein [Planctomycetia bacterium]|nr:PAS domain S-box protein [Planctomycetia bacterium]